jgi:CDP-paratose synthetase
MRIFLTGATGFLGSALARHWHGAGHELVLLARVGSDTRRIEAILPGVRLVRLAGIEGLSELVAQSRPDALVHTACSYGRRGETALGIFDANVRLGMALLQTVLDAPGPCVTWINTGSVLEPQVSLYALSKAQFSQWGATLATEHADTLQFIDVRLQQIYGPGDDNSKFTTHVLETCLANKPRLALTAGEQRRDFIHLDDVVQAYDHILARRAEFATADAIDVGSGTAPRMRDFVELAKQITGASTELDFGAIPYRTNEAMLCVADTARLKALGWVPRFDLEAGLRQTLKQEITS